MKILTEYRITRSQTPLWENRVDNIFDKPSRLRRLSNHPRLPLSWERLLMSLYNHPWLSAIRLLRKRRDYDVIVTGDFRASRVFAFLQMLFPVGRKPQLMIDFMLDDQRPGLIWKIKRALQRSIFKSIDKIVLFSEGERREYSRVLKIDKEKFVVLPYHTNLSSVKYVGGHENYIVSAGNSGRDYATLIEAVKGTGLKLKILAAPSYLSGLEAISGIELLPEMDYMGYLELIAKAKMVVVPLHALLRSVGLVVVLEGMSLGKTVIATKAMSVSEYIENGRNGFLVEPYNVQALRELLLKLDKDRKTLETTGRQAVKDVKARWTYDLFVKTLLKITAETASM